MLSMPEGKNGSGEGVSCMKKHRVLRNLFIDLVCAGLALTVFALFHHVLPRQQQSLCIVITNPYQPETAEKDSGLALPEEAILIASAP